MNESYIYKVDRNIGERLDKYLSTELTNHTRNSLQKLIKDKLVTVNNQDTKPNYKVSKDDIIKITIPKEEPIIILPEKIDFKVEYEDNDILVVNKPKGMLVHPTNTVTSGTLVNGLLYYTNGHLSKIGEYFRPGIVHRLDKDTSGLLIVAKNDISHIALSKMIQNYEIVRIYEALVFGNFEHDKLSGQIDAPIGRHPRERTKMCVIEENSKKALTYYNVIEQYDGYSYLSVKLETGRTHQIRVHMDYIGHSVVGDEIYGPKKQPFKTRGQLLHSKRLEFIHPITKKQIIIQSKTPKYFKDVIDKIN